MTLRDPVCSVSHLLTAVWAAYATLVLVRLTRRDPPRRRAVAVYGASMVALFLASGVFHGVPFTQAEDPAAFRFFQRVDRSAIFLLIAGTNTPCLVVLAGGRRGRLLLRVLWGLAAAGVACVWLLPAPPAAAMVGICTGMGWLGLAPVVRYYRAVGWRGMNWVWAGAGVYTVGAVCELTGWPVVSYGPVRFASHEVFHLCCTAGSLTLFAFVARHVVPHPRPGKMRGHPATSTDPAGCPPAMSAAADDRGIER